MSSLLTYPPVIESKLQAFIKNTKETSLTIRIYFQLSKAVSSNDFSHMGLKLKTVTTGVEKYNGITDACGYEINTQRYYANFSLNAEEMEKLTIGQFYKAQLSFVNCDENTSQIIDRSPWSSAGVIKCTAPISLSIDDLNINENNNNPVDFLGRYINADITEKVYSYCFTIYDKDNQVFETSGTLIHNSSSDETIDQKYNAIDTWTLKKSLDNSKVYRVVYSITTINGYTMESAPYVIREPITVDANIPAKLLATLDPDNGCVSLKLIKPKEHESETAFSGNFVISRYSENLNTWNQICKFNTLSQTPSDIGEIWTDYTIEHGVRYLYCIQAYNSKKLYSHRMIHVVGNENSYLERDLENQPYYIMADFEDAFLTDGERQLKIRYNPKVSSFKPNILENKVETLGGKYPFIFRNGNVEYKEFPISGLLSYLGDEKELFMKGIRPIEYEIKRQRSAAAGSSNRSSWANISEAGTKLTSDNFYRERQFKMEVLKWLTNGQPKLFRSPGEGNYIVRLMNTSLSPNDTLGRMLHTFNTTAYEIAEHSFENLQKYNLLHLPYEDNRTMKFVEKDIGNEYSAGGAMYNVSILNAAPGNKYRIIWMGLTQNASEEIMIGATGAYYFDSDSAPIASIQLIDGDASLGKVHYGYYDTIVPDYFSFIANIISHDEFVQIAGKDKEIEIISTALEDIRRDISRFYTIIARPRHIKTLYAKNGKYYEDPNGTFNEYTQWSDLMIYYVNGIYYNGYPSPTSKLAEKPSQWLKLNNRYILDLSTGAAYDGNDPIYPSTPSNPTVAKMFVPATNGTYWVSDIGDIDAIHLTPGVYVELGYEINEIEYVVETTDETTKDAKAAWKEAFENSRSENPTYTVAQVKALYDAYIVALEEALKQAHKEEYNYVL